jgi:MFS family permease
MYYNITRRFGFGLSRELWLVEVGIFLNTLGWGAVLPFEVIYLHDGRGFSLGTAGLVVGTLTGVAVLTAPLAGPLIDRLGARATTAGAGIALAAGYAGLAFADSPARAFVAAALAGAGNGALNPSQSTLLAALAPRELRHRASAVSRVAANAGFGFGGALGGLVAVYGLNGFVALFLLNALTYVAYVCVVFAVVPEHVAAEPVAGGYRVVLRDRAFVHLALTNIAIIAVGWGVLPWVVPPYAKDSLHVGARLIGLLMLANAVTVVVAQVPIARLAEGRRRVLMVAASGLIFAAACLLVLVARYTEPSAFIVLAVAAILIGIGECFHSTALMPLVADLAPLALRGRYMATIGFSWWVGLALAPIAGTPLLGVSSAAAFGGAATLALAASLSALGLERRLPDASRLTPRPSAPRQAAL